MKILISGFSGKMGQTIYNCSKKFDSITVTEGLVTSDQLEDFSSRFQEVKVLSDVNDSKAEMIIDFSHHSCIKVLLDFCIKTNTPIVIGTTGFTDEELKLVHSASKVVPIFMSSNMSQGVYVLTQLIKTATQMLVDSDIEIIEKHHKNKVDSPSGTALMMSGAVSEVRENSELVFGRNPDSGARKPQEVGIHSIRGGGIVGDHEIDFITNEELISIRHEAFSKNVFADGALKAAIFLFNKQPGLYGMKNLF